MKKLRAGEIRLARDIYNRYLGDLQRVQELREDRKCYNKGTSNYAVLTSRIKGIGIIPNGKVGLIKKELGVN